MQASVDILLPYPLPRFQRHARLNFLGVIAVLHEIFHLQRRSSPFYRALTPLIAQAPE
jgi:hypothetical protein